MFKIFSVRIVMAFMSMIGIIPLLAVSQEYRFLTGTYTSGKSEGIYAYRFDALSGNASLLDITRNIKNPSFITLSPGGKFVYAVSELNGDGHSGKVYSYSIDKASGRMSLLNSQPSGGDDPCYVTVDKTGKWVIVGNYSSGSLSVLPVQQDGSLGVPAGSIKHSGSGANKSRQEQAHVHATVLSADNRFLYVPDLGTDKVFIYSFNENNGSLSAAAQPFQSVEPGAGPRHFAFNSRGSVGYLIEELTGTVSVYSCNPKTGQLKPIQRISTLPKGFTGFAGSADIHLSPDGNFLYASNRGDAHNLAIYKVQGKNGKLKLAGHQSVLGKAPRNFSISPDGKWLLCANQGTDEIVVFARHQGTGLLTDSGNRIKVPMPVCITWVNAF